MHFCTIHNGKMWKQHRLQIDREMWYLYIYLFIYIIKYYSALKTEAIPAICDISFPYAIMLNGIIKLEKDKQFKIPFGNLK